MKKTHLISTLPAVPVLILFLTLLTVPAGAVDRGAKKIAVGQSVTLSAEGSYPWEWSFGDPAILKAVPYTGTTQSQILNKQVQSYDIVGLNPGTATVTVSGYELVWNPSSGESESRSRTDTWTITVAEPCTVTFDRGDGSAPVQQSAYKAELLTPPGAVSRPGFILNGWYTDKALTQRYDFSTPLTGDLTLYAGWTAIDMEETGTAGQDVSGNISDIGAYNIHVNLLPVQDRESGLWGYASKRLRLVIPFRFQQAGEFVTADGGGARAVVKLGSEPDNSYVIDEEGSYIIGSGYEKIELYSNRIRGVRSGLGTRYDINGNEITFSQFEELADQDRRDETSEGWGERWEYLSASSAQWKFQNTDTGETLWVDKVEGLELWSKRLGSKGLFAAKKDGKWGAIHIPSREVLIPCEYDGLYCQEYDSGGYITYKKGTETGFLLPFPSEGEPEAPCAVLSWTAQTVTLRGPASWLHDIHSVWAASYDRNGQLKDLAAGQLDGVTVTFPKRLSPDWKLFFLDASRQPVGASAVLK